MTCSIQKQLPWWAPWLLNVKKCRNILNETGSTRDRHYKLGVSLALHHHSFSWHHSFMAKKLSVAKKSGYLLSINRVEGPIVHLYMSTLILSWFIILFHKPPSQKPLSPTDLQSIFASKFVTDREQLYICIALLVSLAAGTTVAILGLKVHCQPAWCVEERIPNPVWEFLL